MAYRNTPTQDTYSTRRVSLVEDMVKNENYLNVFLEEVKSRSGEQADRHLVKRAGIQTRVASVANAVPRGIYFWPDQAKILYAVENDIYVYYVNTGVQVTLANVFGTSGASPVGMCEFLYDNGTTVVIATDGTTLISIDSADVVVTCADADLPAHLPYPIFLDGYLFLAKVSSATIHNSDLNNPMSWTPGNFIDAELEGDIITGLVKVSNYLVALGTRSIEYFWDAANTSGSPLQRNDAPVRINRLFGGIAQHENTIYYIGQDHNDQLAIFRLKDFQSEPITTPYISRYMADQTGDPSIWTGNIVAFSGHIFYVLSVGAKTFACDLRNGFWSQLGYQSQERIQISYATMVHTRTTGTTTFFLLQNTAELFSFENDLYQDNAVNFMVRIITPKYDFENMFRKTMSAVTVLADRPVTSSSLVVSWTDDDYKTYSTSQTVELNQDYPVIRQLGSFRRRAFKLTHLANTDFRIQGLECSINKGPN